MPAPEEPLAAAHEFLADHPEAEDPLVSLIERDADGDPWTFADIALDSGQFGELVARDLAQSVDGGYRLTHPEAIRAALESDQPNTDSAATATEADPASTAAPSDNDTANVAVLQRLSGSSVNAVTLLGLVGTLLVVAGARLVAVPAVFRDGFVVSPANDTYFFRYWQERLAARADGIFDLGLFADMGGAASARPLAHATNWWVTVLFGGVEAAPPVAAWLPIVSAVCLGYLVYRLARLLTDDVRVALAAVLFYGLAPVNVVYTSVGFLDHQTHQYLWLGLLLITLTTLGADVGKRVAFDDTQTPAQAHARNATMWLVAVVFAVAVAASAHAWGGSPLTFVPVAAVVGLRVAVDVRHDVAPAAANMPLLGGLALGAGLTLAAHLGLGWHESLAAATPLLVTGGAFVVVALGELWYRVTLPSLGLIAAEVVVAIGGAIGYALIRPDDIQRFQVRADDLFFRGGISETVSLFSPDFAVVFGPLLQLGLGFYFGVAVLAVATWAVARHYEPGWLVLVCFAWYYTLLAAIQVRFAGQLAIVIAPFAGIGLVYLLSVIDTARPVTAVGRSTDSNSQSKRTQGRDESTGEKAIVSLGLPDSNRVRGYLVATILVVLLFNLLLVPSLVGQTTHDRAQFDAALTVDAHAEDVGREYPQNFVLSRWDDNRMYNYFVSGESQGYGYARSNHDQFLTSSDPDDWYDQFQGRVGYVVVTEPPSAVPPNSTYRTLHDGLGLGANGTVSTAHYQLLAADDGVRTFAVVHGATVQVSDPGGEVVTANTTVTIESETDTTVYEYTRRTTVANGTATIRVAYPGEYTVGNTTVVLTADDILHGNQTTVQAT